jgi:energy-coupling factor transporter ATP-binding protein EcfA2
MGNDVITGIVSLLLPPALAAVLGVLLPPVLAKKGLLLGPFVKEMGNIFALQGKKGCGKTPTLKLVAEILQTNYPQAPIIPLLSNEGDIKIIIEIDVKVDVKVKVGIASQGDPKPNLILPQTLADFAEAKCDIIFCACRNSGDTVDCINNLVGYAPHFILQIILPDGHTAQQETQSNTLVAQKMIKAAGL